MFSSKTEGGIPFFLFELLVERAWSCKTYHFSKVAVFISGGHTILLRFFNAGRSFSDPLKLSWYVSFM